MAKKKHKQIPLTGATKILRAHSTQIEPPGMLEMKNVFISRSDNAIGVRSDWEPAYEGMFSFSSLVQGTDTEDYLNAAFYVNRAGHTIWFGRLCPFVWDGSTFGLLSTIYNDGTITTNGSEKTVEGIGTLWHQMVWPGCFIRERGEGNDLYTVKEVVSDVRINTFTALPALTDAEYEILRVHPRYRAEWPIRLEALGGYLVYGVADMNQPIDEKYLSGPWFSNIGRPNLGVWIESEPEVDDALIGIGGLSFMHRYGNTRFKGVYDQSFQYTDIELSPLLVAGAEGLCFRKDWLIDGYLASRGTPPTAKAAAVNLSLGTAYRINRVQGNVALTADGKIIDLVSTQGDPAFPPLWAESGSNKTLWFATGGKAIVPGEVALDGVRSTGTANGLFGCISATESFIGENGYFANVSAGGVPSAISTGVTVTLRDVSAHYGPISPATTNAVIVGDNDGSEAVALTYNSYSPTGTFTQRTTGLTTDSLNGVSYSWYKRRYVAVGTSGKVITSDDEGVTWTSRTSGTALDLKGVCHDPDGYCCVAVGGDDTNGGVAFASLDGETWVQLTVTSSAPFVDVVYNDHDGYFYFCDNTYKVFRWRKTIYMDTTPTAHTTGHFDRSSNVTDIVFDGSNFIIVGDKIWTTPDGDNWVEREDDLANDAVLLCVNYDRNSGYIIAAGTEGESYRSTDGGVNWSNVTIDSGGGTVISIASAASPTYSGRLFAVTMDGSMFYSIDGGATWSAQSQFDVGDNLVIAMEAAYGYAEKTINLYVTTQDGAIYAKQCILFPSWAEEDWAEWTDNPGGYSTYNTDFYSFVAIEPLNILQTPAPLCGVNAKGQLVASPGRKTTDWPGTSVGMNKFWQSDITYASDTAIGALNSFDVIKGPDGWARMYSPIICGWTGGSYSQEFLQTSVDSGRTWMTSFQPSVDENRALAPTIAFPHRHYNPVSIKANNSDSKPKTFFFRPLCSDGTYFYCINVYRNGHPPIIYSFEGGLVLGDPLGGVLDAEEYE